MYVPTVEDENVHDAIELPPEYTVMLAGQDTVSPDGVEDGVRLTVPVNPYRLLRVIPALVEPPAVTGTEDGAEMLKSWTVIGTLTEFVEDPLVPMKVSL